MLEDEEPLLGLRALVQPAASLERHERLEVVAHDPRKREVGGGRHDIGDEAGLLAAAVDENGLVIRHVPRRRQGPNAGQDFRSEEHTSELQSLAYLVCRLLLEKKK